jgi:hypothetical protein
MEQVPNGTNSSDTTSNPNRSTIRMVRYLISTPTKIKKESMLELLAQMKREFNRDGSLDTLIR